jgi:DNA-binding transcriptional regulator YiaG
MQALSLIMTNHPNRSRRGNPARNPNPDEIRALRLAAGLTQTEAAAYLFTTVRTWQQWEAGDRAMHPAFWRCIRLDLGLEKPTGK